LQALHKARPIAKDASYEIYEDFPRKGLTAYERVHENCPAVVAVLTYELELDEIEAISDFAGFNLLDELTFSVSHKYDNGFSISLSLPETAYVQHRVNESGLAVEARDKAKDTKTIGALIDTLSDLSLNDEDAAFLEEIEEEFPPKDTWSRFNYYIWNNHIFPKIPKFL
jgi:hypothetical protein